MFLGLRQVEGGYVLSLAVSQALSSLLEDVWGRKEDIMLTGELRSDMGSRMVWGMISSVWERTDLTWGLFETEMRFVRVTSEGKKEGKEDCRL